MNELGMEASSLKGLKDGEIFFVSRCTKACGLTGHAGHSESRKESRMIDVGLALVLRNQDLSNERGQLASKRWSIHQVKKNSEVEGEIRVRMKK